MGKFTLIAGPCVIESEENVMLIAETLLFMRMQFVNIIVNKLAKAAFCVYLIHGYFIGYLKITKVVSMQNPLITILHITACCIGIYLIGFVINLIYSWAIQLIEKPVDRAWKKHRRYTVEL